MSDTTGRGVVLLSGGIDSSVILDEAVNRHGPNGVRCVHYDYGQQTEHIEQENAFNLADHYDVQKPELISIPYLSGGTTADKDYGEAGQEDEFGQSTGYVPMRNLTLLTTAAAYAESVWEDETIVLYHGAQGGDEADYPDCRTSFMRAAQRAIKESTNKNDFIVETPLINKAKTDVLEEADERGVPLEYTFSCYNDQDGQPCGECPACVERVEAFNELGIDDPIEAEAV
jgi:7-cyano-7-deazaguanine synthase